MTICATGGTSGHLWRLRLWWYCEEIS